MVYRFESAITAPKGKLSREDKAEIKSYLDEVRLEEKTAEKAIRALVKKLQGDRLKLDAETGTAEFRLPDYGTGCLIKVKANEEA